MNGEQETVLVVEDDNFISTYLEEKLRERFSTVLATTAADARTALSRQSISLIVLDVLLPEEDGFSLLKDLKKEDSPYKNIPVLILSNLDQPEDITRGQELGAEDYLVKANLTPEEISDKIAAILN